MENKRVYDILNRNFPISIRSHFVPAITRAYEKTLQLFKQNEWLNWVVGKDIISVVRRIAVEYELMRTMDLLNVTYRISPNAIDNCRHLEVITKECILTVSQVRRKDQVPRKAEYRTNLSVSNQFSLPLFDDEPTLPESPYYVLLTHGFAGHAPSFVMLGLPKPYVSGWVGQQIDLLKEPHRTTSSQDQEDADTQLVGLKQHIIERLKGVSLHESTE
ncbi:hypothetical protein [Effusibacillus pohliae]|uniref:hypothetical protein n=1 Tax=Effusibacillus pohliae TaxID=232270 RepID=UPI00037EA00B|nr:hypothetical protein [Effusibacillus pohliae]